MPHEESHTISRLARLARACPEHPWIESLPGLLTKNGESEALSDPALRLYLVLCLLAYAGAHVLVDRVGLEGILGVPPDKALSELEARGLIRVTERGQVLALAVHSWSGGPQHPAAVASVSAERSSALQERKQSRLCRTAGSYESRQKAENSTPAEQKRGTKSSDQPAADWLEGFVDQLVRVLGAEDERSSYRSFCTQYPRQILEAALARVRATPKSQIRKSRGALFTYLVKTFSQTQQ